MATALYGAVICLLCLVPWFAIALPAISGGLLIFVANIVYWSNTYSELSFATVSLLALGVTWGLARIHARPARRTTLAIELVFHAVWITSVYDIRDTLIRIVAFAVLAALFIFIGYLYHRFQSRIE